MGKPAVQGDFRNALWGDTTVDVKKNEQANLFEEDISGNGSGRIIYQGFLASHKALISYLFESGLLVCGCYKLDEKYVSPERYIEVFYEFLNKLKYKYGDKEVIFNWRDRFQQRCYETGDTGLSLAQSVLQDHVSLTCGWCSKNTIIVIEARNPKGTEYEIRVGVTYWDIKYAEKTKYKIDMNGF